MLDEDKLHDLWVSPDSRWSPWVKPVLLAHLQPVYESAPDVRSVEVQWAPPADGRTAIVCDCCGADSVPIGLALAGHGYQPVLLYNALPSPPEMPGSGVVHVDDIMAMIAAASPRLATLTLPPPAPPAFLLDGARRHGSAQAGMFDNRSMSFPTDFPSATVLHAAGISQILLVQEDGRKPQADLARTLYAWQEAGLVILAMGILSDEPPQRIELRKPTWLDWFWLKLDSLLQLHGNARRGFGGFVPHSS